MAETQSLEREREIVAPVGKQDTTRSNVLSEVKTAKRWVPGAHRRNREPVRRRKSKCIT
jgi:hypothetical protein